MSEASLQQAAQLTALLEQQNKLYAAQGQMLKTQIGMMKQLKDVFSQLDYKEKSEDLQDFNSIIEEAVGEMEGFSKTSQSAMGNMSKAMVKSQKDTDNLGGSIDRLVKKGPMIASVILAFDGMTEGIKFSMNAMTAMSSVVGTVIGSLTNLGFSIITLPFKILQGLINMSDGGGGGGLRQALEDIRKEFGSLKTGASEAILDISRSMRGQLAETGLSSWRVFGNLAERLKTVAEYAKNMGNAFDLVRDSFVANAERVGAYIKGLGLSEGAQKALAQTAIRTGNSLQEIGREITTYAYQMGEAFGINGKQISRDVGDMMDDFDAFGNLGVKTLTNITVYARKLGVEFKDLKGVIDKFDNFEQAAEGAAQLSQAFGLQLDTLQLINAQDPAERIEMLRKSFFAAGRSVENMTRQERALLATQTGLDQKTASLVFSLESQGQTYEDIQKQSDATSKKQLTQAEAMEKLSDSIERLVKSGGSGSGGFFDRFLQGFSKGIRRSVEFREVMRNLRKSLLVVHRAGIQVGRAFMEAFPGVKEMTKAVADFFNPTRFRKVMSEVVSIFRKFFKGDLNLEGFQKELKLKFSDFFNIDSPQGQKFKAGVTKFFFKLRDLFIEGLKIGMNALKKGATFLTELIRNPTQAIAGMTATGDSIGSFFMTEIIQPLVATITGPAGRDMMTAIGELFEVAFAFMLKKTTEFAVKYRAPIMKALFAIFVAPAMISGITRGLIGGLGGALVAGMSGALKKGIVALRKGQQAATSAGAATAGSGASDGVMGGRQGNMISRSVDGLGVVMKSVREVDIGGFGKLVKVGGLFAVFGASVLGAMAVLVVAIRAAGFTVTDIARTVFTMTAASLILTEIGLLVKGLQMLGMAPSALKSAAIGFAAVSLTAVGAILMAAGVVELNKQFDLTIPKIAEAAGILASTSLIALSLALVFGVMTASGALAVATSGVAVVGFLALGLAALGAAKLASETKDAFSGLNEDEISITGRVLGSVGFIVTGLAGVLAATVASGILGLLAPLGFLGNAALTLTIDKSAELALAAKQGFADINVNEMMETGRKIGAVAAIIAGIAVIGAAVVVGGASAAISRIANWLGMGGDAIADLVIQIKGVTDSILVAARGLNISTADMKSIESIRVIIGVLSSFTELFTTLASAAGPGLADVASGSGVSLVANITVLNSVIRGLPSQIESLVTTLKTATSNLSTEDIKKIGVVGEVLSSVGNFIKSIIGAATSFPQKGERALQRNLEKITNFLEGIGPAIGGIFASISTSIIETISGPGFNQSKFSAATKSFSEILTSLSSFVGSMIESSRASVGEGAIIAAGQNMQNTITSMVDAISSPDMQKKLEQLMSTIGDLGQNMSPSKLKNITRFSQGLTSISTAMSTIAQNSEGITGASMTRVRTSITSMVDEIKNISESIKSFQGVNLNTELRGLASRLGMASREQLKIEHGNLNITINLKVQVDAKELEDVLLGRDGHRFQTTDSP